MVGGGFDGDGGGGETLGGRTEEHRGKGCSTGDWMAVDRSSDVGGDAGLPELWVHLWVG